MKIERRFTQAGQDVFSTVEWDRRTSRITNPDGSVVFEMKDAEIPSSWSQLATDIMVSKYFRKAGVPQPDGSKGPEKSARQVIHRLAGCWRFWGETHGYFDTADDAQAFYDELCHMMLHQQCAPNSPQWFNTGLHFAYGITGPAQGHHYCDPKTGELKQSTNAYEHPQPHACFIQSVSDDLVNDGGIMDLWTREARLFKYGSGTGSNFSKVRGENEKLSGGGRSSGLMSFLKIGDRAAGAIKSGGTTRRAAKMVCLDLDHPDVEQFVNWKVREEIKVAALAEGMKVLPKETQDLAKQLGLKLDYDFNGEAYFTVSGQNSNNSVRIPNSFFEAIDNDADWNLTARITGKTTKTLKAKDLWEQISFAAWRCADPGVQFDTTINQWHTAPKSGRINASNPCVTGDTRVLTPGGIWRRIDSMIHLPARLLTNVAGKEIHVTEGAFPSGQKDVYELKTAGGYGLKLTADHKVWTRHRGWVPAAQLTTADAVRLPDFHAATEQIGEPQEAELFQLVGLLTSQANGTTNRLHLLNCVPPDHAERLAQYAADHSAANRDDYSNEATPADGGPVDASTLSLTIENRRVLSRLRAYVKSEHGVTRLSDDAFTAGLAAQKHLLRGLFTADAESHVEDTMQISANSADFLRDVQMLLLGFGIKSSVTETCFSAEDSSPTRPIKHHTTTPGYLRIAPESLVKFDRHIGLLLGKKHDQLAIAITHLEVETTNDTGHFDAFASLTHLGVQQVFDLTEPVTHSFVANGLTVHNCSEYMFLDDTACNLASLNVLTFFDAEKRTFDMAGFRHGTKLWTMVLEISVLMASFPSEAIARLSYKFRTLGLGYANLGAMLMQAGIPYDSEKGRAICAALTAVLTGESYATSAEMAREHGPFPGYKDNEEDMLRVIRNHRRAAYDVRHDKGYERTIGDYEGLDILPVGIDASQFEATDTLANRDMLMAAQECWDRALFLGEKHGYRNAQSTVIAPTGTIGLLMDCDTTGVEPDFALVKFKKLAGGGYFKIVNQSLPPSLKALGYTPGETKDILNYVLGTLALDGSPHINRTSLKARGFTDDVLAKIETTLPGTFELTFAFNGWALGEAFMTQLGIPAETWQLPGFNLLRHLGFTKKEIDLANDTICGRGTIEGAPHLKAEHLPVFDCANKCGKHGQRYIAADGHIRMMAAAQPFISGAISKTINLPNEATIDEIKQAYRLSWELGLKANALYRDGSKLSQPLNIKSDDEAENATEADDADNVAAAKDDVASDVALAASVVCGMSSVGNTSSDKPQTTNDKQNIVKPDTRVIERIIERVVERPLRRRLPDTRNAITHKFDVAGHEGYITVGLYEDGTPGEMFITMAKEGSTIGGLMDTVATLVSVALQYGVPTESLLRKFEHTRFEPNGMTRNPEIPMAKSLTDYIFRWMGMEFVPGYRAANAPQRPQRKADAPTPSPHAPSSLISSETAHDDDAHDDASPDAKPFDYGSGLSTHATRPPRPAGVTGTTRSPASPRLSAATALDPLSQQGSQMQSDAPACDVCGSITVRSGTCYKCQNCGNSMGCS